MKQVVTVLPLAEEYRELLQSVSPELEFYHAGPGEVPDEILKKAEIIVGNLAPERVGMAQNLQLLQLNSAGADGYLEPGILPPGARLCNATGAYGLAISEHMLGVLLSLMKNLELYRDAQKEGAWRSQGPVDSLWGATVLVLGMGDIGGEFGRRCKALGAKVIGVRRSPRACPDYAQEVHTLEDLGQLLPQADVVAVTLPGTEATRGLLGREQFAAMKQGAYLLNVGRGFIVDTEALCDALESGRLGGAGLDVTDPEPLPPEHRLWRIPRAVVTPHISGFYHLKETHRRIVNICAENLEKFGRGQPLRNLVDFSTGYRQSPRQ